jgi:NADPH:quinone reductase-like Zn-dependent oxidoreductase
VEGAGRALAVGGDVDEVAVGDRVLAHEAPLPAASGFWASARPTDAPPPQRTITSMDLYVRPYAARLPGWLHRSRLARSC